MRKFNLYQQRLILCITFLFLFFSNTVLGAPRYTRTIENYVMPDVTLVNQDGESINFVEHVNSDEVVIIEFIFATCTTICPILSIRFTHLQQKLGEEAKKVKLVSISIDPEYDTPPIMKDYLRRYNAKPGWDFFTGSVEDIKAVMNGFDAYVSDKMGHRPLIFLKSPKEKSWVRIDGLMSGRELMKEFAQLKK